MESTKKVKITTWEDGFEWEYIGLVHRLDASSKVVHLEKEEGYVMKIEFEDIVGVEITN
jgi:hypothetical protein